jgi:hypothetical protein
MFEEIARSISNDFHDDHRALPVIEERTMAPSSETTGMMAVQF